MIRSIQALRAVAVTAVVVNHYFPSRMPGGFIGVDVFFVISGFLITSKIIADIESGSFSFVPHVRRRYQTMCLPTICLYGNVSRVRVGDGKR
jgi:peptidoglycan/LPS O-acetylase OafA/YrhL